MQLPTVELVFLIDFHIFLQSYIYAHSTLFVHTFSHTPATALLVLAWPLAGVVLTDTQVPVVTDSHILKQESCCQACREPPAIYWSKATVTLSFSLRLLLSLLLSLFTISLSLSLSLFPMISFVHFILHASLVEFASCTLPLLSVFISLSHRTVSAVSVTHTLPVHKHRCYNKWLQRISVTFEGFG